jgi:hypothetical protein
VRAWGLPTHGAMSPMSRIQATHCRHGHDWTPKNSRIDRRGYRHCRACDYARVAAYVASKPKTAKPKLERTLPAEVVLTGVCHGRLFVVDPCKKIVHENKISHAHRMETTECRVWPSRALHVLRVLRVFHRSPSRSWRQSFPRCNDRDAVALRATSRLSINHFVRTDE